MMGAGAVRWRRQARGVSTQEEGREGKEGKNEGEGGGGDGDKQYWRMACRIKYFYL